MVNCAEIFNSQMNKVTGFIALRMGDMQKTVRWIIFCELLSTLAADVLPLDTLRRQFGFSRMPSWCHWSVALALLCLNKWSGNSEAFCQSFEDGSFCLDTCALPCQMVKPYHFFLLTLVGGSLACGYISITMLARKKPSILCHAKPCGI